MNNINDSPLTWTEVAWKYFIKKFKGKPEDAMRWWLFLTIVCNLVLFIFGVFLHAFFVHRLE